MLSPLLQIFGANLTGLPFQVLRGLRPILTYGENMENIIVCWADNMLAHQAAPLDEGDFALDGWAHSDGVSSAIAEAADTWDLP